MQLSENKSYILQFMAIPAIMRTMRAHTYRQLTSIAEQHPVILKNLQVAAAVLLAANSPSPPAGLAMLNRSYDLAKRVERELRSRGLAARV